jgi:hypothetical protein
MTSLHWSHPIWRMAELIYDTTPEHTYAKYLISCNLALFMDQHFYLSRFELLILDWLCTSRLVPWWLPHCPSKGFEPLPRYYQTVAEFKIDERVRSWVLFWPHSSVRAEIGFVPGVRFPWSWEGLSNCYRKRLKKLPSAGDKRRAIGHVMGNAFSGHFLMYPNGIINWCPVKIS